MSKDINIVFEDSNVLVLNKQAGLIVENNPFETSLESIAKEHLLLSTKKQDPFLGIIHRIDRVTSGILVMAKKKSILKIWNKQFAEKKIEKTYLAITNKALPEINGRLEHWLEKDQKNKIALVRQKKNAVCKKGILEYSLLQQKTSHHLYTIRPITGRFHQIRAQLAAMDCPILGDIKYGGKGRLKNAIALHAYSLTSTDSNMHFNCNPPKNSYWDNLESEIISL